MKPGGPVNRSRVVRPPMNASRGALGGPPGRGRGAFGRGGMPIRGDDNQSVEPVAINSLPNAFEDKVFNKDDSQNDNKVEETKDQPAIQKPIENINKKKENRVQLESENDSNTLSVNPPVKQEEYNEPIVNKIEENTEEIQDDPKTMMPKTSHRGGQPQPGNHNIQPPVMASRGRGMRGGPPRGRGGRPPNMGARPTPPIVQDRPKPTIEIEEDEIVHKGDQIKDETSESQSQELPRSNKNVKQSNDNMGFIENKNYEDSESRKKEAKALFGQIFENNDSEKDNRSRGRSPNFSEQRYATHHDDDVDQSNEYQKKNEPKQLKEIKEHKDEIKTKKPKTHRANDLNKSVDLFGINANREEPLITDTNNALNTSFGIENTSDLHNDSDNEDLSAKIFASLTNDDANRSKTPPVRSKRPKLQQESNDRSQYHKPIGAKEDFIFEEPVMEPIRDDSFRYDEQNSTPEISAEFNEKDIVVSNETKLNKDLPSPIAKNQPETIFKTVKHEQKSSKSDKVNAKKRQEMLYDEEEKEMRPKSKNSQQTDSTIRNIKNNLADNKSVPVPLPTNANERSETNYNQSTFVANNLSINMSRNDHTVPISRTSSVKSAPDELEKANDNLKSKKKE